MDMLNTFSIPLLDSMDYSRDILTPEDHHHLNQFSQYNIGTDISTDEWQGSPTYSYTSCSPDDSTEIDEAISMGYEFGDLMSPNYTASQYATPSLAVRNYYKATQQQVPSVYQQSYQPSIYNSQSTPSLTNVSAPTPIPSLYTQSNQTSSSTPCLSAPQDPSYMIPSPTQSESPSPPQSQQIISFEYSKNRTKTTYHIKANIHTVDTSELSEEFKKENCIYPRAAVPKEEYRGNRHQYETECNHIGWSLAHLNPSIRKKRGVIQRAVDSWRNTNPNPKFRSRRVRKLSKKAHQAAQAAAQQQQQQELLHKQQQRLAGYHYQAMQIPSFEYQSHQQRSHSFAGHKSEW